MKNNHRFISGYSNYKSVLNNVISKEQYIALREYAENKGVSLSDFRDYTGKIENIMDIIDKIEIVSNDFPKITEGKHRIVLGLHYEDSEDFAGTESNKITLNGLFYNDTEITAAEYENKMKQRFFVSNTTWRDIIFHELGHIVCNMYRINPLEIAMDLLHTRLKSEIAEYVSQNLSLYAARSYESIITNDMVFDGSEIIAECFCAYYSKSGNIFANAFVKKCISICKEVG